MPVFGFGRALATAVWKPFHEVAVGRREESGRGEWALSSASLSLSSSLSSSLSLSYLDEDQEQSAEGKAIEPIHTRRQQESGRVCKANFVARAPCVQRNGQHKLTATTTLKFQFLRLKPYSRSKSSRAPGSIARGSGRIPSAAAAAKSAAAVLEIVVVFACTEEEQDLENFAEILRVAHGTHLSLLSTRAACHLHAAVAHFKPTCFAKTNETTRRNEPRKTVVQAIVTCRPGIERAPLPPEPAPGTFWRYAISNKKIKKVGCVEHG